MCYVDQLTLCENLQVINRGRGSFLIKWNHCVQVLKQIGQSHGWNLRWSTYNSFTEKTRHMCLVQSKLLRSCFQHFQLFYILCMCFTHILTLFQVSLLPISVYPSCANLLVFPSDFTLDSFPTSPLCLLPKLYLQPDLPEQTGKQIWTYDWLTLSACSPKRTSTKISWNILLTLNCTVSLASSLLPDYLSTWTPCASWKYYIGLSSNSISLPAHPTVVFHPLSVSWTFTCLTLCNSVSINKPMFLPTPEFESWFGVHHVKPWQNQNSYRNMNVNPLLLRHTHLWHPICKKTKNLLYQLYFQL